MKKEQPTRVASDETKTSTGDYARLADARVYKFRFWDSSEEEMFDWDQITPFTQIDFTHEEDLKPMQFSGFKDKNGKEIYECDILGDWTEVDGKMEQSKQTVYFDEMLGQWMLDNSLKQDRTLSFSLFSELQDFEYEVIGNIYENADLLAT